MSENGFNMQKITVPLLAQLLRGKIRFPKLFLLKCKYTSRKLKRKLQKQYPKEFVDLTVLPLWIYMNLKERLGEAMALEIMRIVILTAGLAKQILLFNTIEEGRSFEKLIQQELKVHQKETTKWNTMQVVEQNATRFEIEVSRCLYHELATELNIPEATQLVCQVDNALFNSYLPEKVIFHRGGLKRRICEGCDKCHFIWEKKGN